MAIKSETVFISLAALAYFGLMSQHLAKAEAQNTQSTSTSSSTAGGGWNATLVDRNSPLMQGADMGRPEEVYAGIHNVWATDPITQAMQRLTLNNGQSPVSPANGRQRLNNQGFQNAYGVQNQAAAGNEQASASFATGKRDLSTPLGRFEYYRPIFERRAQQLNEEQRSQQLQFPVYNQKELQFPVYNQKELQFPVYNNN